jgi:hypothetical protein
MELGKAGQLTGQVLDAVVVELELTKLNELAQCGWHGSQPVAGQVQLGHLGQVADGVRNVAETEVAEREAATGPNAAEQSRAAGAAITQRQRDTGRTRHRGRGEQRALIQRGIPAQLGHDLGQALRGEQPGGAVQPQRRQPGAQ